MFIFHYIFYFIVDKPIFVSQNIKTQYGRFGHDVDITIYVFSFPEITSVHVVKDSEFLGNKTEFLNCIENSTLTDTIYNTQVHILGSIITLQRYHLTKDDFTLYEFNVANKIGHATFRIKLSAAGKNKAYLYFLSNNHMENKCHGFILTEKSQYYLILKIAKISRSNSNRKAPPKMAKSTVKTLQPNTNCIIRI